MMSERFLWHDGERLVAFRPGALADAAEILHDQGWESFELVTTARALAGAGEIERVAAAVHTVAAGRVPELAAGLLEVVGCDDLVALGGGRVIDAAKAVAAVRRGRVAAIPTTLSGAELTALHRLPAGHQDATRIRPALVIADPALMTSLPEPELRASAMNALGHGSEALFTRLANPAAALLGVHGAGLIGSALDHRPSGRPSGDLALGSLLCAWALDSAGFALHHVACQTLVRMLGAPHAETNAAMLPLTIELLARRSPQAAGHLARALGTEVGGLGERMGGLAGGRRRLSELGLDRARMVDVREAVLERVELRNLAPPPDRGEVAALLEAAW
jgi:maleylacetate reductase